MKMIFDACTVILLAKASVLEAAARTYSITLPRSVYKEVMAGKEKKLPDSLLTERLIQIKLLSIADGNYQELRENLKKDFGMGNGEAESITLAMKGGFDAVATDNKQGRKAALVNALDLVGSPEIIMALFKLKKITSEKTIHALKLLKKEGWFNELLIERLLEEVEKNV